MKTTPARTQLGVQLALARKKAGYTQAQVATLIKCNSNEISLYETGHRVPDLGRFGELVKLYKADAGRLLFMAAKDIRAKRVE